MKRAMVLAAFGGLATAAMGQSLAVTLSFDRTDIAVGETATATLTASFTWWGPAYFSSINIDLIADSDAFAVSDVTAVPWNNPALGFDGQGVASGSDILGINASQFSLIPPHDVSNPIELMSFTVTRLSEESTRWSPQIASGAPWMFYIIGPVHSGTVDPGFNEESFYGGHIAAIPNPGVLGLVGTGGLLACRRRRR